MIAQLVLIIVQKIAGQKSIFSGSIINLLHLISMQEVFERLRSTMRAYDSKAKGPPGFDQQVKLAFT